MYTVKNSLPSVKYCSRQHVATPQLSGDRGDARNYTFSKIVFVSSPTFIHSFEFSDNVHLQPNRTSVQNIVSLSKKNFFANMFQLFCY